MILKRLKDHILKNINPEPYFNTSLSLDSSLNMTYLEGELFSYGPEKYQELEINGNFLLFYFSETDLQKPRENEAWAVDITSSVFQDPYY